ncbi:hypothetical protein SAMN03159354_00774 [Pseudomonas sp. NFPP19]|nr:hypothetical protein SAMN03159354_00774 [Pseudomonas sp. NFPP19]
MALDTKSSINIFRLQLFKIGVGFFSQYPTSPMKTVLHRSVSLQSNDHPSTEVRVSTNDLVINRVKQLHIVTVSSGFKHRRKPRKKPTNLLAVIVNISPWRLIKRVCDLKKSAFRSRREGTQNFSIFDLFRVFYLALRKLCFFMAPLTNPPRRKHSGNRTNGLSPTRCIGWQPSLLYPVSHRANHQPQSGCSKQQPPQCQKRRLNHSFFKFWPNHRSWPLAIKCVEHAHSDAVRP